MAQINGGILLEWGCLLGMGCIHVHQNVIQYGQYFYSRTFTKESLIVIMSILCVGKTAELSVFISHVIKTNNRNCSTNNFKNLGYDRLLQYKQPCQESGLCTGDVCNGNSPKCILTRVLDFSSDGSDITLTTEEDNRLC